MLSCRVLARAASTVAAASWSFGCTLCGRCCTHGKDRVVLVSAQEVAALERDTGLPSSAFVKPSSEGRPSLLTRPDGNCVFLDDDSKKCTAYSARPTQCRTYPFWGETTTPLGWLRESARCPGISIEQGPATPLEEVALDVVQTDLALAGESTTYKEDRSLLEAIPEVVAQQFEEQMDLGGVVRWDTPELCVIDSPDLQTGRELRTLVLKDAPSLSQSVAFVDGNRVIASELAMPVHQALALALSFAPARPERILVVGGGGCALPLAFATALPHAHVTVVELSRGVADAARRFFIANAPPNLELVVANGAEFVHESLEAYDLVVVDAADAVNSPAPSLATVVFLDALHAKLTAHGMLGVNCFGDAAASFVRSVTERFGSGTATLELKAEVAASVHTVVLAQKGWKHGRAADAWRARLAAESPPGLCGAGAARHAAEHLRPVTC